MLDLACNHTGYEDFNVIFQLFLLKFHKEILKTLFRDLFLKIALIHLSQHFS